MSNSDGFTTQQQAAAVLAERRQRAWNRHRMESAADLLAPEADFVNVVGHWMRGRSQFLEHHVRLHQMQMRDSRWTNLSLTLRTHSKNWRSLIWNGASRAIAIPTAERVHRGADCLPG